MGRPERACIVDRTGIPSAPFITVYDMIMVWHSIGKRDFLAWFGLCNVLQLQLALLVGVFSRFTPEFIQN